MEYLSQKNTVITTATTKTPTWMEALNSKIEEHSDLEDRTALNIQSEQQREENRLGD